MPWERKDFWRIPTQGITIGSMRYEVILDKGEKRNKCTIARLLDRPDFRVLPVRGADRLGPLLSPILLHPEGRCLTEVRKDFGAVSGIATIDCIWRRLEPLLSRVEGPLPVLARIPAGFRTAYPRHSKKQTDPEAGLATIEAIFIAAALLGHWDVGLLSEYFFGREFVELNYRRFQDLGAVGDLGSHPLPPALAPARHASQRRRDRRELFVTQGD